MHGVIAAGSPGTADAGAEILRRGGNAVDAAVAACFATAAAEPTLTSLAGGGVMIHRDAASGEVVVCDFFADAPALRPSEVANLDFRAVDLDFGPTTQRFHIGAGAAAVPGVIPGLCTALERWGSLPLGEVVVPACRMLREGVALGHWQARACTLLEPILTASADGRAMFQKNGHMLGADDRYAQPALAALLEDLARRGWRDAYRELCAAMLAQFSPASGGLITAGDLDGYRVELRPPLELRYRGVRVLTNPPPAAGGTMIARILGALENDQFARAVPGSLEHARQLCRAMAVADQARAREGAALQSWGSTTHVSVLDAHGNAAAATFSFGEGNGAVIGTSGIMMNNLMGEADLHPAGFGNTPPGRRLSTMMAPTLLIDADGGITVLGTGGANRIRSAIAQVVTLLVDRGYDAERAVAAPRLHFEDGVLNAEVMDMPDGGAALGALGAEKLVPFAERNLFFGGVHLVRRDARGVLGGAGDPRRGGTFRQV